MEHIRQGKHGARSTKQAIAIGLSKARRAGIKVPSPRHGFTSQKSAQSAKRASRRSHSKHNPNPRRSRAITNVLKHEGHSAASPAALSKQAHEQAAMRSASERSDIAERAAKTRMAHQTHAERVRIARKAARTRKSHSR
jgi:hypothetical protein